jgi:Mor family transcriptional regulator
MPVNNHWSEERWDSLCKHLCADFGPASAAKIIETIVYSIGGERLTIPSLQDIQDRERDRRICNQFRGDNIAELHATTIRRIILKQRIMDRDRSASGGDGQILDR